MDATALREEQGGRRSAFAPLFKRVVGRTPADHLARYRVALVQERLGRGMPLKVVAYEVGHGSPTALSRAFRERVGHSPRAWLKGQTDGARLPGELRSGSARFHASPVPRRE